MKKLSSNIIDKQIFNQEFHLLALNIPIKQCTKYLQLFNQYLFNKSKIKKIYETNSFTYSSKDNLFDNQLDSKLVSQVDTLLDNTIDSKLENETNHHRRYLILNEAINQNNYQTTLPTNLLNLITNVSTISTNEISDINDINIYIEPFTLVLTYDQLTVQQVLEKLIYSKLDDTIDSQLDSTIVSKADSKLDLTTSYEQVGHIAHLNIREDCLQYKNIIGQVILDKNNHTIRTVVNKIGQIENEFRTFPMELIAGEDDMVVTLKESNCKFTFNFKEVYWNSRLQAEHDRLVRFISDTNSASVNIADLMAGVGPFAIPLSKYTNHNIYANDLNPNSYKYLVENSKSNKCFKNIKCYNLDARDFVIQLQSDRIIISEVIMNLPNNATDFLDVFIGYAHRLGDHYNRNQLPRIHVYAFSTSDDPILDVANRVCGILQCELTQLGYLYNKISTKFDNEIGNKIDNKKANLNSKKVSKVDYKDHSKMTSIDRSLCWGHIVRDVAPKKVAEREPTVYSNTETNDFETKRKQIIDGNDSCNKKKMKPDDNN